MARLKQVIMRPGHTVTLIGRLHGAIVAATGRRDDRSDPLRRRSPRVYPM